MRAHFGNASGVVRLRDYRAAKAVIQDWVKRSVELTDVMTLQCSLLDVKTIFENHFAPALQVASRSP